MTDHTEQLNEIVTRAHDYMRRYQMDLASPYWNVATIQYHPDVLFRAMFNTNQIKVRFPQFFDNDWNKVALDIARCTAISLRVLLVACDYPVKVMEVKLDGDINVLTIIFGVTFREDTDV